MAKAGRLTVSKVLMVLIFLTFVVSMVLMITYNNCECESSEEIERKLKNIKCNQNIAKEDTQIDNKEDDEEGMSNWDPHVLAIIVPFRERFEELLQFVPYMHTFLNMQKVRHEFFIVNQVDGYRFNRASLLNIGVMQAKEKCQYLVMHDVDLLPRNEALRYSFDVVKNGPHHLSSYELHPRYSYETFVGGILLLQMKHYEMLNGLSNKFWGWGREDDEFYMRMKEADLEISRPQGITTGRDSFYHMHDKVRRPRDMTRSQAQRKESFKRDHLTGLDTLQYELIRTHQLKIEGALCTIYHVKVTCDEELTPWCIQTPKRMEDGAWYESSTGVQGVLLDITGVLYNSSDAGGVVIPGSVQAVNKLKSSGLKVRFCTNETMCTRQALVTKLNALGFDIKTEEVFSPIPAVCHLLRQQCLVPHLLVHSDAVADFGDLASSTAPPTCVVIADCGSEFNYDNLNDAFRALMNMEKPTLISLGRGKYYKDDGQLKLDVGAFMKALEYACSCEATVVGKPGESFFMSALNDMGVTPDKALMIGDDIVNDVGGAQHCGIRGLQVRTGKYRPSDEPHAEVKPAGYVDNLAQAVDLLLSNR